MCHPLVGAPDGDLPRRLDAHCFVQKASVGSATLACHRNKLPTRGILFSHGLVGVLGVASSFLLSCLCPRSFYLQSHQEDKKHVTNIKSFPHARAQPGQERLIDRMPGVPSEGTSLVATGHPRISSYISDCVRRLSFSFSGTVVRPVRM